MKKLQLMTMILCAVACGQCSAAVVLGGAPRSIVLTQPADVEAAVAAEAALRAIVGGVATNALTVANAALPATNTIGNAWVEYGADGVLSIACATQRVQVVSVEEGNTGPSVGVYWEQQTAGDAEWEWYLSTDGYRLNTEGGSIPAVVTSPGEELAWTCGEPIDGNFAMNGGNGTEFTLRWVGVTNRYAVTTWMQKWSDPAASGGRVLYADSGTSIGNPYTYLYFDSSRNSFPALSPRGNYTDGSIGVEGVLRVIASPNSQQSRLTFNNGDLSKGMSAAVNFDSDSVVVNASGMISPTVVVGDAIAESSIVRNGTFNTDTEGWVCGSAWARITTSGGMIKRFNPAGAAEPLAQPVANFMLPLVVGNKYRMSFDVLVENAIVGGVDVTCGGVAVTNASGVGSYSVDFACSDDTAGLSFMPAERLGAFRLDNVTLCNLSTMSVTVNGNLSGQRVVADRFELSTGDKGVTAAFETADSKAVTVNNGIVTGVADSSWGTAGWIDIPSSDWRIVGSPVAVSAMTGNVMGRAYANTEDFRIVLNSNDSRMMSFTNIQIKTTWFLAGPTNGIMSLRQRVDGLSSNGIQTGGDNTQIPVPLVSSNITEYVRSLPLVCSNGIATIQFYRSDTLAGTPWLLKVAVKPVQ